MPLDLAHPLDPTPYLVTPGAEVRLDDYATRPGPEFGKKREARKALAGFIDLLRDAQERLWASARWSVLIVLQARDAAGKDSTIKHVMTGVNPQGIEVHSFGPPSAQELRHHFLWRPTLYLPGRGRIAIFNRSWYEEVLVVRVHPHLLEPQRLPLGLEGEALWQSRFDQINHFEQTLVANGTLVLKFMLHLSRERQRQRFLKRLTDERKHWKFSASDLSERARWDDYTHAFEEMLRHTSTSWAPWHVVPADRKWFTRACVADIITSRIEALNLDFPEVTAGQRRELEAARAALEAEQD